MSLKVMDIPIRWGVRSSLWSLETISASLESFAEESGRRDSPKSDEMGPAGTIALELSQRVELLTHWFESSLKSRRFVRDDPPN